jgi:hypothetical protein
MAMQAIELMQQDVVSNAEHWHAVASISASIGQHWLAVDSSGMKFGKPAEGKLEGRQCKLVKRW